MKSLHTKSQASKATKDLGPRDGRDVKAGSLSINFTKIEYKYTPYDDQHK